MHKLLSILLFGFVFSLSLKAGESYANNSVLEKGNWVKVAVDQTGVYRIPYATLQDWGFSNPQKVGVFGFGGQMVPAANSSYRPDDLPAVAVWHHNNALYFYGHGPVSWHWDEQRAMFVHQLHTWDNQAVYFLGDNLAAPKQIQAAAPLSTPANRESHSYDQRHFHENEGINLIESGRKWFGESFSTRQAEHSFSFPVSHRIEEEPVKLYAAAAARSGSVSPLHFTLNNQSSPALNLFVPSVNMNDLDGFYARESAGHASTTAEGAALQLKVRFNNPPANAEAWLDHVGINTRARLRMEGSSLLFRDQEAGGSGHITRFVVQNTSSQTVVWEVSDLLSPKTIPVNHHSGHLDFTFATEALHEFAAFNPSGDLPQPRRLGSVKNQNLHAVNQADYVIVAPEQFFEQAEELAALHQKHRGLNTLIVSPGQIYNEFSWGHTDPTAIRSFLRMLYEKAGENESLRPRYLLLFGHGSYDSRTTDPEKKSLIPTYQSENSIHRTNSYVTDDYFGFLDPDEGDNDRFDQLDIGIGRFPVRTTIDAQIAVDKVRAYLEDQDPGNWRQLLTFMADDGDYNIHMRDADILAERLEQNHDGFNLRKIYLDNFAKTSSTQGDRSPDAEDMVNRSLQQGTLLFNYVGHGGVRGLTAEQVITTASISEWTNIRRLPLFVTATCEFSRYDHPTRVSAGEMVFLNPHGGGIALLTTTRVVYSSLNFQLNSAFVANVFKEMEDGQKPSLGNIIKNTKNAAGNTVNKLNFSLLGDPALRLIYPSKNIKTATINQKDVSVSTDTLKALSTARLSGFVADEGGQPLHSYNGEVEVTVYDKPQEITTLGNGGQTPFQFSQYTAILFRGKATVKEGQFDLSFRIPYDIRYNFAAGKITYYAQSEDSGAAFGSFKDFIVGGFDLDAPEDKEGPEIDLYLNHSAFKEGDPAGKRPVLYAHLKDASGINTSGNGIGHDLVLILNDNHHQPIVLNEYFQASPDDYQSGTIVYLLPELSLGPNQLTLRVWDNYNNSSTAELHFAVEDASRLRIRNFNWHPNPLSVSAAGRFSFETDEANAALSLLVEAHAADGRVVGRWSSRVVANNNLVAPQALSMQQLGIRHPGLYLLRFHIRSNTGKETRHLEKIMVRP